MQVALFMRKMVEYDIASEQSKNQIYALECVSYVCIGMKEGRSRL